MANYSVNITYDKEPINPRDNPLYDKMYCWHDKYNLGDKHNTEHHGDVLKSFVKQFEIDMYDSVLNTKDSLSLNDVILAELNEHMAIEPLYLYDGQYPEISTEKQKNGVQGEFIGYSFMTAEAIEKYYNSPLSPENISSANEVLKDNIDTYSHYLSGDNYLLEILKDAEVLYAIQGFTGKLDDEMLHDMEMTTEDYLIGEDLEYEDIQEMFDIDVKELTDNKTPEFVPNIEADEDLEM